jgi:hypothetical protein
VIAAEINSAARYFGEIVEHHANPDGSALSACLAKQAQRSLPPTESRVHVLNGVLNHSLDIQGVLSDLRASLARSDRVVVVAYSPYWWWVFALASRFGLRKGALPITFVTRSDLSNLARLSGFEITRYRPALYVPFSLLGLGSLLNRIFPALPVLKHIALTSVVTLRPVPDSATASRPSVTIVIPARNERGNIAAAVERIPDLQTDVEVIFVEGHSSDGTWEEIQRVLGEYSGPLRLRALRQAGKGKNDAVRHGFAEANGEVVTILDADLTMPPEMLPRFFDAWCEGLADFVNGSRLVYPMEGHAMRFLNRLGNVFFAKALSYVLDTRITDSLCGTKLLSRSDWQRFQMWRRDFGDFDPFGDFELLFPAAILGLGVIDVPVRYRDRTYGSTNISRFRHGLMLMRMTMIGLFRVKLGKPR